MKEKENGIIVWKMDEQLEDGSRFVGQVETIADRYVATFKGRGEKAHNLAIPGLTFAIARDWVQDAYVIYAKDAHEAKVLSEHPNERDVVIFEKAGKLSDGTPWKTAVGKNTETGEYYGSGVVGKGFNAADDSTFGGERHRSDAERWCERFIELAEQQVREKQKQESPHRGFHR